MGLAMYFNCPKCNQAWESSTEAIKDWKCFCGATVKDLPPLDPNKLVVGKTYVSQYKPKDKHDSKHKPNL